MSLRHSLFGIGFLALCISLSACSKLTPTTSSYQFVPLAALPSITAMPDPLTMFDGSKVSNLQQWQVRRQEMLHILEDYEYGHMPPPPGNVWAELVAPAELVTTEDGIAVSYRKLHLSFGPGQTLGFDLGLFMPANSNANTTPYPALINLTFSAEKTGLGRAKAALARGYAVVSVPYQQLGADSPNYASTGFFPAYPDYDWRDIAAWAWGLSRAVDYLVTEPEIDNKKIIITGSVARRGC